MVTTIPNFDTVNLLNSSSHYMYCHFQYSKILHSAHSVIYAFCISEKQQILSYIVFDDWFLKPRWQVFTVRYKLGL